MAKNAAFVLYVVFFAALMVAVSNAPDPRQALWSEIWLGLVALALSVPMAWVFRSDSHD